MNIEIDGYKINYKKTGSGDRYALILQGWGTTMDIYNSMAATISDSYTVVQVDLPGFGTSDEPREPWNVDAYGDFVVKFIEALEIKSLVLIGHSYGGRIIIKLATRPGIPFEIENIILVDSAGIIPEKTPAQKRKIRRYKILKRIFNIKLIETLLPATVEEWRSRQGSADYRNSSQMMRACMVLAVNEDLRKLLPDIKQDTLLIWGDKDTATPISDAHLMDELIPYSGLVVLEGSGHYSFLEQPQKFKSVMRSYFGLE
ncbi:MAG: alpha/beta hydrolase [Pseudobutyrivibrio sp.]|nr:alpha/beta hydrolase [Pseudobutyrivibrio sp.]